ncbi:hypothetical protein Glove_302g15 [Diversispora epigaea]|uniref:Uncharacterized protein n=1 Tax=Diversispora epigaea TaxID=1348612 RepID=A0A397I1R0_9GLOM|nr:hypothetical protein Glove_302g15 [Diversispora epigaea]
MVAKIKSAIFSTFGEDSLPNINNNTTQKDIMDWKKKKEVRKVFEKLHKKINNENTNMMLLKLRSIRDNMVAKIKSAIFSTFGEDSLPNINNNTTQKDIMDWKKKKEVRKKVFSNPDKVGKPLLAFAVGVIEIILDLDNRGIKVKDEIMKSKIRKNIKYLYSLELFSKSEKNNNNNINEDNEDVSVIYIDFNEENDINLFQMDDKSKME